MQGEAGQTFYRYLPVAKRDRDWGLFITTVGESCLGPGHTYPPAGHPKGYEFRARDGRRLQEYQLIYISAGRGWFKAASSPRVRIEAGLVMLLFPGVWHSYAPAAATGWNEHWVGFNGELVKRLVQRGFFTPKRPIVRVGAEHKMLALFRELMEATRGNSAALQQRLAGTVAQMLALLYCAQQSELVGDNPGQQIIHQAVTRLREDPRLPVDMPGLARELKVSYRWFRRAFAHHTGLSPHHYLLDVRLARARDLLLQTTLSTKEVALRVGFEDAQYFCRLFRKKIGKPPGLWRHYARKHAAVFSMASKTAKGREHGTGTSVVREGSPAGPALPRSFSLKTTPTAKPQPGEV